MTYLLLWLGQEGITIYNSWEITEEEKKDYKAIMKKFENYLEPKTNFRVARYNLQKFMQAENESSDEFLTRCRTQAKKCKFDPAKEFDEKLIEQLIIGTRHKKVQKTLLGKDDKLTLDAAMNEARTYEALITHMSQLNSAQAHGAQVNVDATRQFGKPKSDKCGKCGYSSILRFSS